MSRYTNGLSIMDSVAVNEPKAHWMPKGFFNLPESTIQFQDYLKNRHSNLKYVCTRKGQNREYIALTECGFDIETTSVDVGKEHHGYMYIWQFAFDDMLIKGRTWSQFHWVMSQIQARHPELGIKQANNGSEKHSVLMAVANLGYEFQYLSRQKFNGKYIVDNAFLRTARDPLSVEFSWGLNQGAFKAIDVLEIASPSLKELGKSYCRTQKLDGDLDYSISRNSKTPLTWKEEGYCNNDVIVLHEYMTYYLNVFVKRCKQTPLTKTSIVKSAIAYNFIKMGYDVRDLVNLFPDTYADYEKQLTFLYRGGYTHANSRHVGKTLENVHGFDFTSSYTAWALTELFPIGKFQLKQLDCVNSKLLDEYANKHNRCWYATFTFNGLWARTDQAVESLDKIFEVFEGGRRTEVTKKDAVQQHHIIVDNGRIKAAEKMTVMLTEQDWKVYRKSYAWNSFEMTDFYEAERGPLPKYITDVFKFFYAKKASLKRLGYTEETAYIVAKQMVNTIYGLMVQHVHLESAIFDPETEVEVTTEADKETAYKKAVLKGRFLKNSRGYSRTPTYWMPPQYGIWITAYARRRILEAIDYLDEDAVYSDTDSVYFKNYDKHKEWFKEWNETRKEVNRALLKDEVFDELGCFDPIVIKHKEGASSEYSFKTWGSKRYIKMDSDGHLEQTISGLSKDTVIKSILKEHPEWDERTAAMNCFDVFQDGLELDLDDSQKLTTAYNDEAHEDVVVDSYGNSELMKECSSACLYQIPFKMTVKDYYQALSLGVQSKMRIPTEAA